MANPIDDLRTFQTAAVAAIGMSDWGTALANLISMQTILAMHPDIQRNSGTGGGSQGMTWDRATVEANIRRVTLHKNAALGIQASDIVFSNPSNY
jgi:hypothetical protein